MSITIGYVSQTSEFEFRVGITPEVAKRALKMYKHPNGDELEFLVEKGAGLAAHFSDADYEAAGVKVVSHKEALNADYVGFITTPDDKDISAMKKGSVAIGLFNSLSDDAIADKFKKAGVTAVDMNLLPRKLSMAQSMDAMTSQSSVAGYKAVLLAATEYGSFLPMLTTAAGTIKPASVLVLGAGIAGLQAIGTAKRLGAIVTAFDVRPESAEEIASLGAKFLDLGKYGAGDVAKALFAGQGDGGYARALTPEELTAQKSATDAALADFDIVITTAQVPGRKPPQFVSNNGIKNMKPGSVVVDLAASTLGGNVEGSVPNERVTVDGVTILGAPDLASSAATSASNLLARNIADVCTYYITNTATENGVNYAGLGELLAMIITGEADIVSAPADELEDAQVATESSELEVAPEDAAPLGPESTSDTNESEEK